MEIGGIVLLAAALVILAVVPYAVSRRTAITQSREIDRFSPRMRMLSDTGTTPESQGGTVPQRLISTSTQVRQIEGGHMVSQQGPARRPTVTSRSEKQRLREIAQLRARRAARRSTEVAAGKRRMVLSGFFAALTALVTVVAALSTAVAWGWALLPLAALVATLTVSRMAAVRFEEASRAEQTRLEELMGLVPMGEANAGEHLAESESVASASAESKPMAEAGEAEHGGAAAAPGADVAGDDAETQADVEACVRADAETDAEVTAGAALAADEADAVAAEEAAQASAQADAPAQWVPTPIPAPMYAQRPRVGGRLVHPDTDLRGIPKVAASVPMRPSEVSEAGATLRSTEEIAASQAVSFDLDAVLESRRAL